MLATVDAPNDVEELLRLYSRQQRMLSTYFQSRVEDPQLAADLLQETIAHAIAARSSYRGDSPEELNGWLWAIARNTLTDTRRRLEIQRRVEANLGRARAAEEDAGIERVEDLAAFELLRNAVSSEVATLPPDLAQAVRLHVVEDLSYRELAERLGITRVAARARVSRGLRRISASLLPLYHEWRRTGP